MFYQYSVYFIILAAIAAVCGLIGYYAGKRKGDRRAASAGILPVVHKQMIEKQKSNAMELQASRDLLYNIIDFLPDATFAIDTDGKVIAWNKSIEKMTGIEKSDIVGKGDNEYSGAFYGDNKPMLIDYLFKKDPYLKNKHDYLSCEAENLVSEGFLPKLNGGKGAYLWAAASPLFNSNGGLVGAIETVRDITNIKEIETKLFYLSNHDNLTGLYNRNFFEEELTKIDPVLHYPLSILIADINGLKLINDAFGNSSGDEILRYAANCIRKHCGPEDVAARWGGDEFIVLLFNTDAAQVKILVEKISRECKKIIRGARTLSIAFGAATETDANKSMPEIIKDAEDQMYRHKLLASKSIQNSIIKSLTKTMYERNIETKAHISRITQYSCRLGKAALVPFDQFDKLILHAKLHDIGKIAISTDILNKSKKLSGSELEEVKKHSEIGYRIASSTALLRPAAEYILHQHEWWNGKGYPHGLKGEKIPLISRIVSIVDAYDVMTSERPYKNAMTEKEAIEELKRFAGIQFDPGLVEKFTILLSKQGF
jgi:diguanylate cyclase (GGDEF)-like protein